SRARPPCPTRRSSDLIGDADRVESRAHLGDPFPVAHALQVGRLQMPDRGDGAGRDRWRQRGREDESARIGADEIDKPRRTGDVAADDPEGLAERAFYDR